MKNRILAGITIAAALVFIDTACKIDTNSLAITIPCFASLGWLAAFVFANWDKDGNRLYSKKGAEMNQITIAPAQRKEKHKEEPAS